MGNTKAATAAATAAAAPTKRKKKGRPSLIDLQKRNLRLQKLQDEANDIVNPNPNPPARLPSSATPVRRSARRNPDASAEPSASSDEDGVGSSGRRPKKLRHVLHISPSRRCVPESPSGPDSDSVSPAERRCKREREHQASKATGALQEPVDSGPTTPLPDSKLLVFILDRLQKKDTYGVFSEPVDPDELPDYHDIIEHPMDFATIRKNVAEGAYANLEQFEKDVFLISSNAMRYNAPDTIYFRQARAIQELAKKDFENLRQESDDDELEHTKPARRGRPSSKSIFKKFGRSPAERAGSDFSNATPANAGDNDQGSKVLHDLTHKGPEKSLELLTRPFGLRNLEAHNWSELKSEKNEDNSGSAMRSSGMKYGKKISVVDENRRMSYKESQSSNPECEPSVLMTFDGDRKQLMPVGLQMEHAYARSLARFAANLGPVAWDVASKKIERVISPGTKFGHGWIGENDIPQHSPTVLLSKFPVCSSQPLTISSTSGVSADEHPSSGLVVETVCTSTADLRTVASSTNPNRSMKSMEEVETGRNKEIGFRAQSGGSGYSIWPRIPFQLHQNPAMDPTLNGVSNQLGFQQLSQVGGIVMPPKQLDNYGSEVATHSQVLDMISRNNKNFVNHARINNLNTEKVNSVVNPSVSLSKSIQHFHDSSHDTQGLQNMKPVSAPPDLNVGLQSPRSPASSVLVDSQHSNLALQL